MPPVAFCPASKPYAVNGSKCIACNGTNQYFNLSNASCVACPNGLVYDSLLHNCVKGVYISNFATLNISLVIQTNVTNLTSLNQTQVKNANNYPLVNCSSAKPLFNGSHCIACPNGTYYLIANLTCYKPHLASNVSALNASHRYVNLGSYNLANLFVKLNNSGYPYQACPETAPLYNGSQCIACANGSYYDLKSLKCIVSQFASNVTALNKTRQVLAIGPYNLTFLQN